jgi:hypothetical protein
VPVSLECGGTCSSGKTRPFSGAGPNTLGLGIPCTFRPESQLGLRSLPSSPSSLPPPGRQFARLTREGDVEGDVGTIGKSVRWRTADRRILPVRPNNARAREIASPTKSSLSQEGNFRGFGARRVHVPSKAQLPKVLVGPGVTSPKSRPPGCRAGHAGHESFPLVLPGPYLLASTRSWR